MSGIVLCRESEVTKSGKTLACLKAASGRARPWLAVVVLLLVGCAGPALNEELIARQSNAMFDHFWNSEWVVSAVNLDVDPDPEFVQQAWADLQAKNRAAEELAAFGLEAQDWRDDLIQAGAELHELRADAAIQSIVDVPPVKGEFVGLHTKAVVVDREYVFTGSMNFDPRSFNINTEAGAFVRSPGLAAELADVMARDMQPENAWQVRLDDDGDPYWVNSDETVYKQPARNTSQRVMDKIFKVVPKEQY